MFTLNELDRLSTPELVRVAFAVAALLRERAGRPALVDADAEALHEELVEAGNKGVAIEGLRGVLVRLA